MYTEMLPGNQMLALIITQVTETMAGQYICEASYARTEDLKAVVDIQTYGKRTCRLSVRRAKQTSGYSIAHICFPSIFEFQFQLDGKMHQ